MKQNAFEKWLIDNNRPNRYVKTLLTIANDLKKVNYYNNDLYLISDVTIAKKVKEDYLNYDQYFEKNKRGQNMYNSAFNRYIEFLENYKGESELINDIEKIIDNKIPISTEKQNLVKCRIGQGTFREQLIELWQGCTVTKFKNIDILIASHIKPWSVSSNEERLDKFNGFLLTPNLDKLFDKGYISFDNSGKILISPSLKDFELLGVTIEMTISLKEEHIKYLNYHRDEIFKKKGLNKNR